MVKNPPVNARDMVSIPGLGRSLGVGSDNPLQDSCLGNPLDKGVGGHMGCDPCVHGVTKMGTWLNN